MDSGTIEHNSLESQNRPMVYHNLRIKRAQYKFLCFELHYRIDVYIRTFLRSFFFFLFCSAMFGQIARAIQISTFNLPSNFPSRLGQNVYTSRHEFPSIHKQNDFTIYPRIKPYVFWHVKDSCQKCFFFLFFFFYTIIKRSYAIPMLECYRFPVFRLSVHFAKKRKKEKIEKKYILDPSK